MNIAQDFSVSTNNDDYLNDDQGRLDIDVARVMSRMLNLGILDSSQISSEIEKQDFLQKCLSTISFSSEITEFLAILAIFKNESIDITRDKFFHACSAFALNLQFERQLRSYISQLVYMHNNRYSSQGSISQSNEMLEFANSSEHIVIGTYLYDYINFRSIRNRALVTSICIHWDYIYEDVQNWILILVEREIAYKNDFLEDAKGRQHEQISSYERSVLDLELSLSQFSTSLAPKLPIPNLQSNIPDQQNISNDISLQVSTISPSSDISSSYNSLEELLNFMTPENTHNLIDWGEPVGNEIW